MDAGELIEFEAHDDHAHEEDAHDHDEHDDHGHEEEEKHDDHDDVHEHDDHHDHDDHADEHESHDDHGDEHDKHDDEGHEGHNHGGPDPHVWLVPDLAIRQIGAIAEALSEIDPDNAQMYMANATSYVQVLEKLDEDIQVQFSGVTPKPFVVFHDAYSYFLREYGLTEFRKASIEPFPGREPSTAYFQELVELIKNDNIKIIFTEPQFNPRVAENIQLETGANSFEMDSVGVALSANEHERMMRGMTDAFISSFAADE